MIVKVQLSLYSSTGAQRVLIYDQGRGFLYTGDVDWHIAGVMRGRPKAFFEATANGGVLEIGQEVPDPGW